MNTRIYRGARIMSGIIMCGLLSVSAFAKDTSLTKDKVTRFLAAFPEMRIIAVSEGMKIGGELASSNNYILGIMKAIKSTKLQTEARTIAEKHGFVTLKEWSETGRAIGQAYVHVSAAQTGVSPKKLERHKEAAAREIEKFGFLTQKQKDKIKENLNDASEELSRVPPPENVAVVKEMQSSISSALQIPVR